MTVEELNAVDMLNDISNTANQMIEKRYKTFANENLRETANNSLREIQLKADELRKEIIGRNDFYQALILLDEIKYIEYILKTFDENKEMELFINADDQKEGYVKSFSISVELKERILDAMREEVKRLNVEFEKL